MKIDQETLAVLDRCTTSPCVVVLPEQLPRELYVKVDKVLKAAGGKWNRKTRAHVFTEDATSVIEQALLTGEIGNPKQELGVFYTPLLLARKAAGLLRLDRPGLSVLEPSAGIGALAMAARGAGAGDVTCLDVLPKHVATCKELGFYAAEGDFMRWGEPAPTYDRVLMNPPFAQQADAAHFHRALQWLKPGGRIVAIMGAGVTFRETMLYRGIRALPDISIEPLPANSFKESGTGVNTALVVYDKPKT